MKRRKDLHAVMGVVVCLNSAQPNVLNICEARHKAVAEEAKARHLAVLQVPVKGRCVEFQRFVCLFHGFESGSGRDQAITKVSGSSKGR